MINLRAVAERWVNTLPQHFGRACHKSTSVGRMGASWYVLAGVRPTGGRVGGRIERSIFATVRFERLAVQMMDLILGIGLTQNALALNRDCSV